MADALTQAIAEGARLVLVGDVDQLPSVGPGSFLRDAIDSGVVPCVRLVRIFRRGAECFGGVVCGRWARPGAGAGKTGLTARADFCRPCGCVIEGGNEEILARETGTGGLLVERFRA